jgi:hypothetical protein
MTTTTYHKDEAGARSASLVMRKFDFFRELTSHRLLRPSRDSLCGNFATFTRTVSNDKPQKLSRAKSRVPMRGA